MHKRSKGKKSKLPSKPVQNVVSKASKLGGRKGGKK